MIIELCLDVKFGFFIIAITVLLELTLIGIRFYLKECLKEYSEFHELVHNVDNKYWKELAEKELLRAKDVLKQMAMGKRDLSAQEITFEELRLIREAKKYIYCVYYADSLTKLKIRLNSGLKYNPMTAINVAYKKLGKTKLCKKRVFIIDKVDMNDSDIRNTLEEIDKYYSSKEIGFEVRYIYFSKLREMNIAYHGNLVLIDDIECTICTDQTEYPSDYIDKDQNIVRVVNGSNIINKKILEDYKHNFDKIWEMALSFSDLE